VDDFERDIFVDAMRDLDPGITDYLEALLFALEIVPCVSTPREVRYFGAISDGTFYADGDPDHTRWFPDTSPYEAIGSLAAEFGQDFTEGLEGEEDECSY
jgi:hypothetical protein